MEIQPLLRVASASMFSSRVNISLSKRDTVPELAAVLSRALLPMTALIAGSCDKPLVVIGVLVARKTSVNRLSEQPADLVLDVLARPALHYQVPCHIGEAHHLVEFSYSQQTRVSCYLCS